MNRLLLIEAVLCVAASLFLAGCGKNMKAQDSVTSGGTGPQPAVVESSANASNFRVDHPERFRCVSAQQHWAAPELNVTGAVTPDVSRQVPVISLASGRIAEIDARLGDTVHKGQLLFKVRSTDVSGAYSDYRKAVKNEELTKIQLQRAKILYDDGAIPKSALEIAQNAEDDALVDLQTTSEHLNQLGSDPDHPSGTVSVFAPVSGVVTDQQITQSAGVQALSTPNPLTISDMTHVWVLCDVYENDLAQVHLGEEADIRLNAYPDRVLEGRISNISPIMDPNIRTAKVRIEVANPGLMRLGMFVTATFHGAARQLIAAVPSSAILHLHDREWVYTPLGSGAFHRVEVVSGKMLPENMQEIVSGLKPGAEVIADALVFQNTVEQ